MVKELLRDSSRSDRELAKIIGVSQPTVSRTKKLLREEEIIHALVAFPDLYKIGFELMAITFVKIKAVLASREVRERNFAKVKAWMDSEKKVIFCGPCNGFGAHSFFISVHKNYADFDTFITKHNKELGYELLLDLESVLINLAEDQQIKPFNFKYLADDKQ
ncbi:MAG: Lrp/AsnC family transcriptional regulator [Candidatus Bathyarchaeota archaeon]|nr:Lrp/AsnC family transcriptional regulator [Candidatus Bathyarchaeota archaeon]